MVEASCNCPRCAALSYARMDLRTFAKKISRKRPEELSSYLSHTLSELQRFVREQKARECQGTGSRA
jgi:hypothetical protein